MYDKKRIQDDAWEETDSSKVLKKEENHRNKTGRPKTSHQIFDSENQQKENKVHKQVFSLMRTTTKQEEGGAFPADYNHVSVVSRNVKSPCPAGRHPLEELFLERPKIQIDARDEPSAIAVLGQTRL